MDSRIVGQLSGHKACILAIDFLHEHRHGLTGQLSGFLGRNSLHFP